MTTIWYYIKTIILWLLHFFAFTVAAGELQSFYLNGSIAPPYISSGLTNVIKLKVIVYIANRLSAIIDQRLTI